MSINISVLLFKKVNIYILFLGTNYKNSTAFVITFLVNNHLKDEDNEKAKAWEKVLISYLQSKQDHPNMTISFSTEVRTVPLTT